MGPCVCRDDKEFRETREGTLASWLPLYEHARERLKSRNSSKMRIRALADRPGESSYGIRTRRPQTPRPLQDLGGFRAAAADRLGDDGGTDRRGQCGAVFLLQRFL